MTLRTFHRGDFEGFGLGMKFDIRGVRSIFLGLDPKSEKFCIAGLGINTPGVDGRYCIQFFEIRISDFTLLRGTRREDAESGVFLGHTLTRFRDPGSGPHPRKGVRMPTSRMVLGDPLGQT